MVIVILVGYSNVILMVIVNGYSNVSQSFTVFNSFYNYKKESIPLLHYVRCRKSYEYVTFLIVLVVSCYVI